MGYIQCVGDRYLLRLPRAEPARLPLRHRTGRHVEDFGEGLDAQTAEFAGLSDACALTLTYPDFYVWLPPDLDNHMESNYTESPRSPSRGNYND